VNEIQQIAGLLKMNLCEFFFNGKSLKISI